MIEQDLLINDTGIHKTYLFDTVSPALKNHKHSKLVSLHCNRGILFKYLLDYAKHAKHSNLHLKCHSKISKSAPYKLWMVFIMFNEILTLAPLMKILRNHVQRI